MGELNEHEEALAKWRDFFGKVLKMAMDADPMRHASVAIVRTRLYRTGPEGLRREADGWRGCASSHPSRAWASEMHEVAYLLEHVARSLDAGKEPSWPNRGGCCFGH